MKTNSNGNSDTSTKENGSPVSKSPIQFFPSVEEMEAIDQIAFRLISARGDGRIGRTTVSRLIVSAGLRDKFFLLKHFPELKEGTPDAIAKLFNSKS